MSGMRAFKLCAIGAAIVLTGAFAEPDVPGTVMQNVAAYIGGGAIHSRYQVVASRSPLGKPVQYQWHLSVFTQDSSQAYQLAYQSPSANDRYGLVPRLEPGHGTTRFFPQETIGIAGAAQLMGEARDQTVVVVHATAADCGESTVSILSVNDGVVSIPVQVTNLCSLTASIAHHTIVLRGPYYNKTAPAYKPTKSHATATLKYSDGVWVERPQYFRLNYPKGPPAAVRPLVSPSPLFTPIFKSIITTPAPRERPRRHGRGSQANYFASIAPEVDTQDAGKAAGFYTQEPLRRSRVSRPAHRTSLAGSRAYPCARSGLQSDLSRFVALNAGCASSI